MSTPVRNLLWKEWREQRWKLMLGSTILAGLAGIGLWVQIVPSDEVIRLSVLVGMLLWPIFVAMGLVAYERGEGSLHSLLALPVPGELVLVVKLVVGAVACVVPLGAAAAVVAVLAGGRDVPVAEVLANYAGAAVVALSLMLWTVCFSVRQPTEGRAGLVGTLVMLVIVFSATGALDARWGCVNPVSALGLVDAYNFATHRWIPSQLGGPVSDIETAFVLVQCSLAVALFLLAAVRLPREARSRI